MSLGILFNGLYDANAFVAFAKEAEALGIDSAWIAEQPGHRDAFAVAAAVTRPTNLQAYVGAISPYTHHPMTIAMSAATLNELAPGRIGLVIGTGSIPNQESYGVRVEHPTQIMRETVRCLRALLAGETLDFQGARFAFHQARLGLSAPALPLYLAAIGPKMQATAGAIADGVVFSSGHSPRFLAESRRRVHLTHAASDRARYPFTYVGFVVASVASDRTRAFDKSKALLSYLFSTPHKAEDWALNGVTVDHAAILAALRRQDGQAARELVGDDVVELCSASGTPDAYQARIRAYLDVGLDALVLAPLGSPEEKKQAVQLALEAYRAVPRGLG